MAKLSDKIIMDAEERAQGIIAEARRRSDSLIEEAERGAADITAERDKSAIQKGEASVRRYEINARLDSGKELLAKKLEIVDGVFEKALGKLCALPPVDYATFVGKLLEKYADEGDEVVLSSKCPCRQRIAELSVMSRKNLTLSDKTGDFAGGATLVGKRCDKDLTFDALVNEQREKLQAQIAAELFGKE